MVDEGRLKKVATTALVPGLYVTELDRPWTDTPFLFQGFEIRQAEEIRLLRQYCQHVWVDQARSRVPTPSTASVTSDTPEGDTVHHLRRGFQVAREAREMGQELMGRIVKRLEQGLPVDLGGISPVIAQLDRAVIRHPDAMLWLTALRATDERLVVHSINTCCLSLLLGHHLQVPARDQAALAIAGLLHDVGKCALPQAHIFEPMPLRLDDWERIRACPHIGADRLSRCGLDPLILTLIRQHQERLDGEGFPDGLKGEQIHPLALLLGICNAYDAMTSDWPRRPALGGHQALIQLSRLAENRWGRQAANGLSRVLGIYPAGSGVSLENGARAIVLGSRPAMRLKPTIIIFRNPDGSEPSRYVLTDLSVPGQRHRIAGPLPHDRQQDRLLLSITERLLVA